MVVIKINELPQVGSAGLKSRAEKRWRITLAKLSGQTRAVVMYKGTILEEYEILSYKSDVKEPERVAFDFSIVTNSKLKCQKVDYPTSNPCTVTDRLCIVV